jgi:hypothetical protein
MYNDDILALAYALAVLVMLSLLALGALIVLGV